MSISISSYFMKINCIAFFNMGEFMHNRKPISRGLIRTNLWYASAKGCRMGRKYLTFNVHGSFISKLIFTCSKSTLETL